MELIGLGLGFSIYLEEPTVLRLCGDPNTHKIPASSYSSPLTYCTCTACVIAAATGHLGRREKQEDSTIMRGQLHRALS